VTLLVTRCAVTVTNSSPSRTREGYRAQQKHLGTLNSNSEETVPGKKL
jgi:hypothetical protein